MRIGSVNLTQTVGFIVKNMRIGGCTLGGFGLGRAVFSLRDDQTLSEGTQLYLARVKPPPGASGLILYFCLED